MCFLLFFFLHDIFSAVCSFVIFCVDFSDLDFITYLKGMYGNMVHADSFKIQK